MKSISLYLVLALIVNSVLPATAYAGDIVCVNDLNGNGYAGEPGETAICNSNESKTSYYCPIGAVACDISDNVILEPSVDSCPSGYTMDEESDLCTKEGYETTPPNMSCPSGYTYHSSTGLCRKGGVSTTQPQLSCPSGTSLSGGRCKGKLSGYQCKTNPSASKQCLYSSGIDSAYSTVTKESPIVGAITYSYHWSSLTALANDTTSSAISKNGYVYWPGRLKNTIGSGYTIEYFEICRCDKDQFVDMGAPSRSCPSGYNYNSSSGLCQKSTVQTTQPSPTCSSGFSYNAAQGICEKSTVITVPISHDCEEEGFTYVPSKGKCELVEQVASCPLSNGGACVENGSSGQPFCSPNPCMDKDDEITQDDIDGTMLVDNGERDEAGACVDQVLIFNGRASECLPSGTSTGFNDCCDNASGEISNDSVGSLGDLSTVVSTIQNIYKVTAAAGAAYSSSIASGASQTAAVEAASGAASAEISALLNPATIAWAIAIYVIMDYLMQACDEMSIETSMSAESGYCHEIGTYCKKEWFGSCVQKAKSYCCFQSKMARIIHEQGRPQLKAFGDWGFPENPDCRGFTPEEFRTLDFSQIDMSEYYDDLVHKTQSQMKNTIQQATGDYFDSIK